MASNIGRRIGPQFTPSKRIPLPLQNQTDVVNMTKIVQDYQDSQLPPHLYKAKKYKERLEAGLEAGAPLSAEIERKQKIAKAKKLDLYE